MAKHRLRQKMHLEKVLSKRVGSLETVEGILLKIQGAATDAEVMINNFSFFIIEFQVYQANSYVIIIALLQIDNRYI